MMRKILVVGDRPTPGGRVLPYGGPTCDLHGHRVALIGGRAYCEGSTASASSPRPEGLEGRNSYRRRRWREMWWSATARCRSLCFLFCSSRHCYDDEDTQAVEITPNAATSNTQAATTAALQMAAFKKTVDDGVTHPPEAEQTEKICPNMTNKEFAILALKLRDMAIDYITKKRLPELERWDEEAQARARTWFGIADQSMREHLRKGLAACVRVLQGLEAKNFVRFTASGKLVTCVLDNGFGTVAAVCKPDTATHTIAIALPFCEFESDNKTIFGTDKVRDGDSRLLTLIHEVTHFDDTFGSNDTWYGTVKSRRQVNSQNLEALRVNADSIAAYILGVDPKASK
jgi:hypothetical protein